MQNGMCSVVPESNDDSIFATGEPLDDTEYANYYKCPCGAKWSDTADCMCNDRCPDCNKEIEPCESKEI